MDDVLGNIFVSILTGSEDGSILRTLYAETSAGRRALCRPAEAGISE